MDENHGILTKTSMFRSAKQSVEKTFAIEWHSTNSSFAFAPFPSSKYSAGYFAALRSARNLNVGCLVIEIRLEGDSFVTKIGF